MNTQTDIFRKTGITVEKDEQARAAVKAFRGLLPTLNAYVRILTKRPDVRIEMAAGDNGSTDGKKIYFRPPIALGDKTPHDRRKCDKRDDSLQLLCKACAIRESVLVTIYHEIAHICFDTFAPATERDITRTIQGAVASVGSSYGKKIEQRIHRLPPHRRQSYMDLANTISPWLPIIVNSLEDARVNGEMFKARPGTKIMFAADEWKIFTEGVEQVDKATGQVKIVKWSEYPPNYQVIVGLFAKAAGHDYDQFFMPQVVQALDDETITKLINRLDKMAGASGTYFLSFPILARLRELGFCKSPIDPEPEPEEQPQDAQPQESNDEQDDEDEGESQQKPELGEASGSGERDDSQDGGADEERPDADRKEDEVAGDDESDGSPEDDSESSDDSDSGDGANEDQQADSDGSDDSEGQSEDAGDDDSGAGLGEAADQEGARGGDDQSDDSTGDGDDSDGRSDDGAGEESSDAGGVSAGEGGDSDGDADQRSDDSAGAPLYDDEEEVDEQADEGAADGDGSSSEGSDGEPEGDSDASGMGGSDDSASEGRLPSEEGSEAEGRDDSEACEDEGPRSDPSADAAEREAGAEPSEERGDTQSQSRPGDGDDFGDGDGAPEEDGSDMPGVQPEAGDDGGEKDEGEPLDSGADEGEGGIKVQPLPEDMGTPDEAGEALDKWLHHDEKPKEAFEVKDEEAVDRALVQGIYFESPSINIFGVREHMFDKPATTSTGKVYKGAWDPRKHGRHYSKRELGIDGDFEPSEKILGPALMRMRVAFSDNQRGHEQRHLKGGKIDSRVLGRRAHFGDERLFKRRQIPGKKDYFVLIGMDVSGSTAGTNLVLEKQAVMAQARLLSRMGIKFAIYAHSGGFHGDEASFTAAMDVDIYLVKNPDEAFADKVEERLASLGPDSGNLDGHTLEYYRKVLDRVDATDKIILYYTDGKMPASNHDEELEILQREIRTCKHKGYTLLGVGIRTDSPTQHGLDTVQVDSEEDVVKVVKHIEKRLVTR